METLGEALARRRAKVEVPQGCFDGYGLEQVGSKGSAPESCPAGPVEESRMTDDEEDEYCEYSDEYSSRTSEGSGEEHVEVLSTGANKDVLKEADEWSDEPMTEALEGEESEEEYSDEYSEDECSIISADETSGANKEAEKDTGSAEKEGRSPQGSGEERLDVSSTGANKEVLKEDEEYLHAEDSEDGEYSDEEECSSQHSVAEYKDVMASGPKADEASGANEEAEKEDTGSAEKEGRSPQGSGEERLDVSSSGANKEVLKEHEEYLHAEDSEDSEYSDEEECSSQHSVAEHNDVMASEAEADEASGANEEAEKEIVSKVSGPEGGDSMCPAPPCDLQEEADKDSGSAEKDDRPLQASGELRVLSNGANNGALNEKDEYSDGSGSEGLEGEEGEEDEYSDEEESECSSQCSVAEHNDVMASEAEADEASGANEEAEKEIVSKVSVPEGGDFMCPAPPCDLQEEADKDSGSAEQDDRPLPASGELRVLSMAGVAGAVESTATMPPTLLTCSILRRGYSDACERLLRATAFQEMEKAFTYSDITNRLLEQESLTDLDKDDNFVAPQRSPDEEHLDVPSTGATKLHQECEDPDESGSEYSDERSDEELEEASADVVGGPDEEAEKVDQKVDSEASADVVGGPDEEAEKVETVDTNGSTGPVIRREVPLSCQSLLTDPFEVAVKRQSPPSSILVRDATKPRPKKTLRFSEHVDHRSISPRPRSASAPENSGTADKPHGKKRAAQSGPSTVTTPVPVQSSSFSEFLFLPPVPENKTGPLLSNFLFSPNGSSAQHAVPAIEMESSRRSGEEHHPGCDHHHSRDAHHHSSDAHRSSEAHDRGSGSMVHDSSPCQVADQMAREAHERGLGCSLEQRVLERAYFLFLNGHSSDADENYFTALRIEMTLSSV